MIENPTEDSTLADWAHPVPVIAGFVRPTSGFILFSLVISGLIAIKHKGNIERLWKGTENKIGQSQSG